MQNPFGDYHPAVVCPCIQLFDGPLNWFDLGSHAKKPYLRVANDDRIATSLSHTGHTNTRTRRVVRFVALCRKVGESYFVLDKEHLPSRVAIGDNCL